MGGGLRGNRPRWIDGRDVKSRPYSTLADYEHEEDTDSIEDVLKRRLNYANDRDTELHNQHLEEIKDVINDHIEGAVQVKLGGSVSKRTYVEGLSDVDVLLLLDRSELNGESPEKAKAYLAAILRSNLSDAEVSTGKLAVTVAFKDGTEVQLIPAVKSYTGYRIPDSSGEGWSNVIHPEKFAEKLTAVNQKCKGGVIPVIKLVKDINREYGDDQKMKGYHIESLAYQIFRNYPEDAPHTNEAMLHYFYEHAPEAVLRPIKDSTGQSVHTDDYAGDQNSLRRKQQSAQLRETAKKLQYASEHKDSSVLPAPLNRTE